MKKYYIGLIVILFITIIISLVFVFSDKNEKINDATKFSSEYTKVDKDNVFVYRNIDEIIKIMENGTGVVYLGFPECKWCQAYVKILNETAKEVGIEKIYYFNISSDRKSNTDNYKKIVSILSGNLQYDNEGNERIYVPNVSFHIKGKLIGNDYETSLDTHNLNSPEEYWTENEISDLKNTLKEYMEQIKLANKNCSECNK